MSSWELKNGKAVHTCALVAGYNSQQTRDAMITSLLRQNDATTSFWHSNNATVMLWLCCPILAGLWAVSSRQPFTQRNVCSLHIDGQPPYRLRHRAFKKNPNVNDTLGGRFKNAYELLNLRALKFQSFIKIISFNVWVRYFVWNFKGYLWNSTQNI